MTVQAIAQTAATIAVPRLVHFTRVTNLPSIMNHGLYPISKAFTIGVTPEVNDTLRLDGHRDATSLSITFPNNLMFWKYRQENPDVDWAVLLISPSVLWTKNCAFCRYNAADTRISGQFVNQLKTHASFLSMFAEIDGFKSRQEQRLQPFDTTDVQAEVLAFDIIEPELIIGVAFNKATVRDKYLPFFENKKVLLNNTTGGFFASRTYVR